MKPMLYYCNTIYTKPISDINPLILQRYRDKKFLVLCARSGQEKRITTMLGKAENSDLDLTYFGWWHASAMGLLDDAGLINYDYLSFFDIVIILSRSRIDTVFHSLLERVEAYLA